MNTFLHENDFFNAVKGLFDTTPLPTAAVADAVKDPQNYLYAGLAVVILVVLYLLWKELKKYHHDY